MPKQRLVKTPKKNPGTKVLKDKDFEDEEPIEIEYDSTPNGLVPIGDSGFYITPDEPADPRDCDRYPESIYCGGFPWTEVPIGLEPVLLIDECNIGISLTPILGFTILPPINLVYRKPECRVEIKEEDTYIPPDIDYNIPVLLPSNNCSNREHSIIINYVDYTSLLQTFRDNEDGITRSNFLEDFIEIINIDFPYSGDITIPARTGTLIQDYINPEYPNIERVKPIAAITFNYPVRNDSYLYRYTEEELNGVPLVMQEAEYGLVGSPLTDILYVFPDGSTPFTTVIEGFPIRASSYVLASQQLIPSGGATDTRSTRNTSDSGTIDDFNSDYYLEQTTVNYTITVACYGTSTLRKRECCMKCCPPQDDTLLRLLIKKIDKLSTVVGVDFESEIDPPNIVGKVDKLSKTIGVDDYPVSLPTSLISRDEGFLGNLIPNFNEDVPNLTRFLAWYVERFDEIMGQWEIPIEVKDSDPSKPGDQPLGVKLPNMAEAIAEMFTLAFQTNLNSEVLLNFAVRTAAETVTDKQQNFITYKLMQSMAEWAGYKQKEIKLKMPTLFSLGKTRYDEILKESEIDVPCVDFDEKFGLEADLMRFREAVAILQANYKKKVDPSGDIKGQILKHLLDTFTAVNKVNPEDDEADFEKFLKEVEDGFINTPGVTNTTQPYGRPYTERPKIRDLTKLDPPTNP